jgi:hypothetical protein
LKYGLPEQDRALKPADNAEKPADNADEATISEGLA